MDFSVLDKTLAVTVDIVYKDRVRMQNKKYSPHGLSHYEDFLQLTFWRVMSTIVVVPHR